MQKGRKMNYVVTGINEGYWHNWGSSWILSLRDVAKYQGKVLVVAQNLSDSTKNKLRSKEVEIIECEKDETNIRTSTIRKIMERAEKGDNKFVYWDADVFFQEEIDGIFDLIEDKFLVTKNLNRGFIAARSKRWNTLEDIEKFIELAKDEIVYEKMFDILVKNMEKLTNKVENTWNFVDIQEAKRNELGLITHREILQKAIHPTGNIKHTISGSGFLFFEKEKEKHQNFISSKNHTTRKLLTKKY